MVLVEIMPRYARNTRAHIWDFMSSHIYGFTFLDEANAAY